MDYCQNCVYDTVAQRHLKNLMNGLSDEQWAIENLNLKETKDEDY